MGTRRTHNLEFKQRAVEVSDQPGASIAGLAMAHGINAIQLHKWRRQLLATKAVVTQPQMLPVMIAQEPASMPDAPSAKEGSIDIQFSRARVSVRGRVILMRSKPFCPPCVSDDRSAQWRPDLARRWRD